MNQHEQAIRKAKTVNELCAALSAYCNEKGETALMGAARYCEAAAHLRKQGIVLDFRTNGMHVTITPRKAA